MGTGPAFVGAAAGGAACAPEAVWAAAGAPATIAITTAQSI
jgi:hypothetical protein